MAAAPDAKYKITDISLEYEIVTQHTLAKHISDEYQSMALLYDRVLKHRQIKLNKSEQPTVQLWILHCKGISALSFEISLNINDLFVLLSQFPYIFNFIARLISGSENDHLISI